MGGALGAVGVRTVDWNRQNTLGGEQMRKKATAREREELLCHSEEAMSPVWPFQMNSHSFNLSLLDPT